LQGLQYGAIAAVLDVDHQGDPKSVVRDADLELRRKTLFLHYFKFGFFGANIADGLKRRLPWKELNAGMTFFKNVFW